MRKIANSTAKAPRVAAAGPLISSVSRPQLDLGDPPIVKIDTPEQGRELVRKLAAQKPDYIKIWYIVRTNAGATRRRSNRSERHFRRSFTPSSRKATRANCASQCMPPSWKPRAPRWKKAPTFSFTALPTNSVDDAFVKLLKERGTILTPTLVVFERYGRTFANRLNLTAEEKAWGNPEVIASLDVTKLPPDKVPDRIKTALRYPMRHSIASRRPTTSRSRI